MDKKARQKALDIVAARRKQMIDDNSTSLALTKSGKDTILFGVEKEDDGYRVAVHYILDGVLVDKKVGASQLKHHAIAIMEQFISNYVIDYYENPAKFFESVVVA